MRSGGSAKKVECTANLLNAKMRPLNERLWIEGNTSIAYGRSSGTPTGDLFSLTFFPGEMKQALDIPPQDVSHFATTTDATGHFHITLDKIITFPYAQHMLSDAPGVHTHYKNESELLKAAESVNFSKIKTLGQK